LKRVSLLAALLLLACSKSAAPPYGFGSAPEQRFRFEANEETVVDGTPVTIVRLADVVLRAKREPDDSARDTNLELFIERYFMRVEGGPGGESELSISEDGLRAMTAEGPVSLGANDKTPGGDTVLEMRASPAAGVALDSDGSSEGAIWTSSHPVWTSVSLLDWILLALPTRASPDGKRWTAKRVLPQIGQYALGLDVDVRWEEASGPLALRGSGTATRESLRLAEGFEGRAAVDARTEADLEADGRVREARLQLALDFAATNGTHVASSHTVRIRCTSCGGDVNSPQAGSDTQRGRDGISQQQRYLDDLPDHGGVRRGL
jgi:hypothetical protein